MPFVKKLVLASLSPFRKKLLQSAGIQFETTAALIDEKDIFESNPNLLARKRSLAKGASLVQKHTQTLVISGDQTLSLNGRIYEKVRTRDEAFEVLKSLSGQTHTLHTAISITWLNELNDQAVTLVDDCLDIKMPMRSLSEQELNSYLATNEWQGTVGCYQAEHQGIQLFEFPQHSMPDASQIVGLPLALLLHRLRTLGVNPLANPKGPWSLSI